MRCFACDRIHSTYHDGPTGRFYCNNCINLIWLDLGSRKQGLTDGEKSVTLEELVEEEFGIKDAISEFADSSDVS